METFETWCQRLSDLQRERGLPDRQIWVDCGDVIVKTAQLYLRPMPAGGRRVLTQARFEIAQSNNVGIELQAICTVSDAICCFLVVPTDLDQAERLMIPSTGVKLSIVTNPPVAIPVTNAFSWWFAQMGAQDFLSLTHAS